MLCLLVLDLLSITWFGGGALSRHIPIGVLHLVARRATTECLEAVGAISSKALQSCCQALSGSYLVLTRHRYPRMDLRRLIFLALALASACGPTSAPRAAVTPSGAAT